MSWGPYPAESSGSTSAWPNQVADGYNYGPSGALEFVVYILSRVFLTISLLASPFNHAENTTFTNSQIYANFNTTQIQARSTGA